MSLFKRNPKPGPKAIPSAGRTRLLPEGTLYQVQPNGSWRRLSLRKCEIRDEERGGNRNKGGRRRAQAQRKQVA